MIDRLIKGREQLETIEDVNRVVSEFQAHLATINWNPTCAERREWDEYVARLRRQRAAKRDARQARVNAREVAQVRQAACPRCFSTHAGEC